MTALMTRVVATVILQLHYIAHYVLTGCVMLCRIKQKENLAVNDLEWVMGSID